MLQTQPLPLTHPTVLFLHRLTSRPPSTNKWSAQRKTCTFFPLSFGSRVLYRRTVMFCVFAGSSRTSYCGRSLPSISVQTGSLCLIARGASTGHCGFGCAKPHDRSHVGRWISFLAHIVCFDTSSESTLAIITSCVTIDSFWRHVQRNTCE